MRLTNVKIKTAQPTAKAYKLFDGGGLFLLIKPNGTKSWRLKYRIHGKEKLLALGVYPSMSLKAAREAREAAKRMIGNSIDPVQEKARQRAEKAAETASSFESMAKTWHKGRASTLTEDHALKIWRSLERDVLPFIGNRPISSVTAPEILNLLNKVVARGALETAHRIRSICSQIFRFGIAHGHAVSDPCRDLRDALPPVKEQHLAAVTDPREVGRLLLALESYQGSYITQCALRLAPLLFVRPGELRAAEWAEFDWENSLWRIGAERMKCRTEHLVPLSWQALEILGDLRPLTGQGRLVFPGARSKSRPMSNNTVVAALRSLGYSKDQMTGHGFRSMASTLLNEQGWNRDAIERQLAHAERNNIRAAYNRAEHLPERTRMMQAWADYLDQLKERARSQHDSLAA